MNRELKIVAWEHFAAAAASEASQPRMRAFRSQGGGGGGDGGLRDGSRTCSKRSRRRTRRTPSLTHPVPSSTLTTTCVRECCVFV